MTEVMLAAIGWQELLLIALIVILLFGATKIPQVMRGLGQGVNEFKKGLKGDEAQPPAGPVQNPPSDTKKDKPA